MTVARECRMRRLDRIGASVSRARGRLVVCDLCGVHGARCAPHFHLCILECIHVVTCTVSSKIEIIVGYVVSSRHVDDLSQARNQAQLKNRKPTRDRRVIRALYPFSRARSAR